jgi:hypothetical protein
VKHPEKIVENVEETLVKNNKRGKNLDFNFLIRYKNAQEARESIDEDKCWKKGNKTESGIGTKQVYKCIFNKSSGCEAKCYLLYHDDDDGVSHYHSIFEHNEHISDNSHGITSKYKDAIDSIYALFQKPKQIKAQLINMFPKNNKDDFPTEIQLKNYISYKRTKQGYKAKLNLGELELWCSEHEKVPEDVDEMFVKRSFKLEENSHKVVFFIFFTT